jgi:hypothetical protein
MPCTLIACPSCACHAKPSEPACPSCGEPLRRHDGTVPRAAVAVMLGLTAAGSLGAGCFVAAYGVAGTGGSPTTSTGSASSSHGSGGGGTGGAPTVAPTFSCDVDTTSGTTSTHECSEYVDFPEADVAAEMSSCTSQNGTFGTGCSATGVLGTCSFPSIGTTTVSYYSDTGETATEAQADCASLNGNWTPG